MIAYKGGRRHFGEPDRDRDRSGLKANQEVSLDPSRAYVHTAFAIEHFVVDPTIPMGLLPEAGDDYYQIREEVVVK